MVAAVERPVADPHGDGVERRHGVVRGGRVALVLARASAAAAASAGAERLELRLGQLPV